MNMFAVGAVGVAAALAAGAVWVQHQDAAGLRQEVSLLRGEMRQMAGDLQAVRAGAGARGGESVAVIAVENAAPGSGAASELSRLREEMSAMRKSTQEITQFIQAASAMKNLAAGDALVPTKLIPADALKDQGRLSPEAGIQTALWAAVGGDVETLAKSVVLTPTAQQKAEAWFAGLSEATRQQYGTPERVIALMIARDAAGLSGVQVIGQKEIAPDNVGVRLRFGSVDGKTKDDSVLMRKVSDGWRMVIPDNAVEKFARQLAGKP